MNFAKMRSGLKKDGWLLAALLICVAFCLLLSGQGDGSEEGRISRVLSSMQGAGAVNVAVYYDEGSVPCGAVVVADGARDMAVQLRLTSAVSTLLGIDATRVAVYPSENGGR